MTQFPRTVAERYLFSFSFFVAVILTISKTKSQTQFECKKLKPTEVAAQRQCTKANWRLVRKENVQSHRVIKKKKKNEASFNLFPGFEKKNTKTDEWYLPLPEWIL